MHIREQVQELMVEYRRPWKLGALSVGIGLLIVGSFYYEAPDWDIPISFIMALFAYFTAAWSMRVVLTRQWRRFPLMLFLTWFTVDGCYWLYWKFKNPVALELMREANFPASLSLYAMCGLVWYYRGTFKQLLGAVQALLGGFDNNRA
ncbi:hypothetical protein [Noviherbaspirillum massiliense]|uniref:hypothetical protein n=1 Tax=Noviherbaspirillum massiliense TaxID=1465823 RepID=UPI0003809588|nr:hypothetical protein [Noviherbaspirillum massiliense]